MIQSVFLITGHIRDIKLLMLWFLSMGMAFLCYLPWLIQHVVQPDPPPVNLGFLYGQQPILDLVRSALNGILKFIWAEELRPYKFRWFFIVLLLLGLFGLRYRSRLWLFLLWVFVPVAVILLVDTTFGTHASSVNRYYNLSAPALYALLTIGLLTIRPIWISRVTTCMVLVYLIVGSFETVKGKIRHRDDFKEAGQQIARDARPEDLVVMISKGPAFPSIILARYMAQPKTILKIPAMDESRIDLSALAEQPDSYGQLTVIISELNPGDSGGFNPLSVTQKVPAFEFVSSQRYKALSVYRYHRKEIATISGAWRTVGG